MPTEHATAIVLKVVDWSETSCVVTLYTREFGKVRGLAKGARRLKGPFESALDLLAQCRVVFIRKSSDALDLLTEAKLLRRFRPPGRDVARLYAGYYVAELLDELTDDYDPHPGLFDAAERALEDLAGIEQAGGLILKFELSALAAVGHLPALAACAECGRAATAQGAGRVMFGMLSGGVLCPACRPGKQHVVSVSAAAMAALARTAQESGGRSREPIDRRLQGELRGVMNRYLVNLLGHRPRMHAYLGTLSE
jgi:DNA repair protein RecO (recombination protein O)